jgi:hypothetical protein
MFNIILIYINYFIATLGLVYTGKNLLDTTALSH